MRKRTSFLFETRKKMIIDCHTHIERVGYDISTDEHMFGCERVDKALVLAGCEGPSDEANAKVADYVRGNDKMAGFAVINPVEDRINLDAVSVLINKQGFKGVVVYCCEHNCHPAHSRAMIVYEHLVNLSVPVFFHNCPSYSAGADMRFGEPMLIDEIARKFPELKIIVSSMGQPYVDQTVVLLGKHENVYADLTIKPEHVWQTYNTVLKAYQGGIMDKLLFGSGYPTATAPECIETLLGFNKLLTNTDLPTVPREKIRSVIERNALEVLGIN